MATKRKRIQVTLSDEVWALVDEVHLLTGESKSAVVSEILDQVAPVFQSQIQALRYVKEGRVEDAQRLINQHASTALRDMAQAQLDLDEVVDARTVKGKRKKSGGVGGRTA